MNIKKNLLKNCAAISFASLLVFSVPIYVYATATATGNGGRKANLKSEGIIEYTDGEHTVFIDSGDLTYLADEIDGLEVAAKLGTLQAIQSLPDAAAMAGLAGKGSGDLSGLTFADLNNAIRISQQSTAVPGAAEILAGKTTWANGKKITGTMKNNGATGASDLKAGGSYTIPAGYTTGGTVTAASIASQTPADAIAANITAGKTVWVFGKLITGTGEDNNTFYEQGYAAGSSANAGLTGNSVIVQCRNIEKGENYKLVFEFDTGITGKVLGKSIIISPWQGEHNADSGGGSNVVKNIEYNTDTGKGTMETFGAWYSSIKVYY